MCWLCWPNKALTGLWHCREGTHGNPALEGPQTNRLHLPKLKPLQMGTCQQDALLPQVVSLPCIHAVSLTTVKNIVHISGSSAVLGLAIFP